MWVNSCNWVLHVQAVFPFFKVLWSPTENNSNTGWIVDVPYSNAFVYNIWTEDKCNKCGSSGHLKICSKCRGVRYCVSIILETHKPTSQLMFHMQTLQSRDCQKLDWPDHKGDCRVFYDATKEAMEGKYEIHPIYKWEVPRIYLAMIRLGLGLGLG
jgi:hypothetical protein